MKRIGLMGCGQVASYGHLPAIVKTEGLTLSALFDPDPQRLRQAQERFGAEHAATTMEAFFAAPIDAVVITSPLPFHMDNVLAAAKHAKPVLCEKPLAMNDQDGRRMVDAMAAGGVPLYTAFTYRFSPAAMEIHRLVRQGAIGALRDLRLIYLWDLHGAYSPRDSDQVNERRLGRMIEGGPMVDCGVHQIDLARWWTGAEVTSVQSVGVWVDPQTAPDHVYLHMDHASGVHTMVEISYSYGHTARDPRRVFVYELIGTDGLIRYDRQARLFEVVNRQGTQTLQWTPEKNFEGMYQAFARALETGEPGNLPSAEDGLVATRIAREATDEAIKAHAGARAAALLEHGG